MICILEHDCEPRVKRRGRKTFDVSSAQHIIAFCRRGRLVNVELSLSDYAEYYHNLISSSARTSLHLLIYELPYISVARQVTAFFLQVLMKIWTMEIWRFGELMVCWKGLLRPFISFNHENKTKVGAFEIFRACHVIKNVTGKNLNI